ncbi:GNAT family N-acetyltransferase, partial [bacterium]|nr:GNAT family N-acetyltransferase [bacterium]
FADENDVDLILDFIRQLADYENRIHEVIATEDSIKEALFERKLAEVIISEYEGNPVGFALFFHNFSTFLGKPGIYIEDLYVNPEMRGRGIGTLMLAFLARLTLERKCGRLEWAVLNWNEPSIKFYKKIGAEPKDEWTLYKISGEALENLSAKIFYKY